jgi:hypothetical protein
MLASGCAAGCAAGVAGVCVAAGVVACVAAGVVACVAAPGTPVDAVAGDVLLIHPATISTVLLSKLN